jgi:hypothetical protein
MKNLGYHKELRCWRVLSETALQMINLPEDTDPSVVDAECERMEKIAMTPPEVLPEPTPVEKLDAAITEYIAATGLAVTGKAEEAIATMILERVPLERKVVYLREQADAAAMDAAAFDKMGVGDLVKEVL